MIQFAAETSTSMGAGSGGILLIIALVLLFSGGKGGRGR